MRPDIDTYFINMVQLVATRGTCSRRKTGCVLVNERNHVLATGYNGRASHMDTCFERPCMAAGSQSGQNLDGCEAIHAEANALLQCKDVYEIDTAYCTTAPCVHCVKLLMNTGCRRIVFLDDYPHSQSRLMWEHSYYQKGKSLMRRDWDQYRLPSEHFIEILDVPEDTVNNIE